MNFTRVGSLYSAASALALLGLCGLDVAANAGPRDAKFVLVLGALALGLGALHGLLWAGLIALSARVPLRARALGWLLLGLVAAALVASSLNAFSRLSGRYRVQAGLVLLAAGVGACGLVAIVLGAHGATRRAPPGWLLRLRHGRRALASLTLFLGAAGLTVCDRVLYAELYPQAHQALGLGALWLCMFSIVLLVHDLAWERVPAYAWLVAPIALCAAAFAFKSEDVAALHAFAKRPWSAYVLNAAHRLTDVDGDGYSSLFGGSDCAPFKRRIHPGAHEIPNNGIDDNCILGDAHPVVAPSNDAPLPSTPSPIDVVLITVDSLRADRLGVYNAAFGAKGRATTPALDAYAQHRCVVFERAYSPGGGTNVALPSILRGRYPRRLRWRKYYETARYALVRGLNAVPKDDSASSMFPLAYDDPNLTLPEWLSRRGMFTAAVLDDGFSEMLQRGTGIERGFKRFLQTDDQTPARRDDRGTADLLLQTLRGAPHDKRLFVWAHFFGTHGPNELHPGARAYGPTLVDGYDHEINYLDQQLARVLPMLDRWPRPLAVFFTADHGDVMEDGRYHGYTLRDDVGRVPLLACVSGWKPSHVTWPVSTVDLLPTIMALTQTPAPSDLDGVDLQPLAEGGDAPPGRILLSDSWLFTTGDAARVNLVSARDASERVTKNLISGVPYFDPARLGDHSNVSESRLLRWIDAYLEETGGALNLQK